MNDYEFYEIKILHGKTDNYITKFLYVYEPRYQFDGSGIFRALDKAKEKAAEFTGEPLYDARRLCHINKDNMNGAAVMTSFGVPESKTQW